MKLTHTLIKVVSALIFGLFLASCFKKDYDAPNDNSDYDPNLTVTHTIAEVQAMAPDMPITENVVISGIVNMDDASGNYYKKIVIQDETGGINILLDQNNLYNEYPIGRKVYIKVKGMVLGDYGGLPELGYKLSSSGSLLAVPFNLIKDFVVKANYPNAIEPVGVTIAELQSPNAMKHLINKVIKIKDAEFAQDALNLPYADAGTNTNRKINECSSEKSITLRTSGYSKFFNQTVPNGKGVITGIYTRYNNIPQLAIRDTTDVVFTESRCDGTTPTGPSLITIDSLKKRYSGTNVNLSGESVTGVVISDRTNGNINGQNLILQQGERGIMIRFKSTHNFNLGDSLRINLSGGVLGEYKNLLQVNKVMNTLAQKVGVGTVIPKLITIADLNADFENLESTLVKIQNATISGNGTTFSGNKTLNDGTGSIALYTSSAASFAGQNIPNVAKNYTGLVGQYNATKQLQLRRAEDVE